MSKFVDNITWPSSKKIIIAVGSVATGIALYALYKRNSDNRPSTSVRKISKLPDEFEALDGLETTVLYLERLLSDLEKTKSKSDSERNRYELIHSILIRLRGAKSDFERFKSNDFGGQNNATEEIARSLWSTSMTPKASTLSVLSDDTFFSAVDDSTQNLADFESNSISVDFGEMEFYKEGVRQARKGNIKVRKNRAEFCQCDSDEDFLAKVYCIRRAFTKILANEKTRQWLIKEGRIIFADLMRHDLKNPTDFFIAYDKLMDFVNNPANHQLMEKELELRKVEEFNLWDVLFDFVLLDSFDDLRKPPSSIVALFKNNFFSKSFKESTLNSLIWSMIKVKRAKLQNQNGFISHFYDISQVVSPMLIVAYFGDGPKAFQELCVYFKESVFAFVCDIFNYQKVRFTNLDELAEDIQRLLEIRLENMQVKISNELIPA